MSGKRQTKKLPTILSVVFVSLYNFGLHQQYVTHTIEISANGNLTQTSFHFLINLQTP
ncbi:hypothetical protein OPHB3_0961 [Oceanobacillus picturae]|uniref:Uncharacterized protein n=1 Tax=Oceanobacillus picturae TaxID=171693 RepID=A0A0U9HDG6_9BACI|nr:hypothetical protein OPHB3_0961 [Oceanobacillus picturae]